jgi:hypothetical protein
MLFDFLNVSYHRRTSYRFLNKARQNFQYPIANKKEVIASNLLVYADEPESVLSLHDVRGL